MGVFLCIRGSVHCCRVSTADTTAAAGKARNGLETVIARKSGAITRRDCREIIRELTYRYLTDDEVKPLPVASPRRAILPPRPPDDPDTASESNE